MCTGLVGGGRWRPKKNDCIPVCPKLKCFKWIKDAGSMNLDATLNIYFKDERFWCRIRTIIKNAVEQALGKYIYIYIYNKRFLPR